MNDPGAIGRAWVFVNGFDVPLLTEEKRLDWSRIISALSEEQFRTAASKSRQRPTEAARFRPSIEEFKSYANIPSSTQRPYRNPNADYAKTDACAEAAERVFSQFAHLMPSRRNKVSE